MKKTFGIFIAIVRFTLFWIWAILQVPIALVLLPFGVRAGVGQFSFFTKVVLKIAGIRVRVYGEMSTARPLLMVGNHISVFEFMTFPATFGGSFFGKDDIAKMPFVGPMARFFGVVFVSRRTSDAAKMAELIDKKMRRVSWPMMIYPEGTTTNGSVVLPFKSSMFDFIEKGAKVTVQPITMLYRDGAGHAIDDQVLADEYAYFDNAKMPAGAKLCRKERSWIGQMFHVFALGGFIVEFHLLPTPPLADMDRKQIAEILHKKVSEKFMELK